MKKLFWLLPMILIAILAGCNNDKPTPDERLSQYIKLWNDQKFDEMYDYLSSDAKKSVSKEDYVSRYEKLYSDLEITDLDVSYKKLSDDQKDDNKKKESAEIPFTAKMNSMAGEISFDKDAKLVKEERDKEDNWYIDWDTTYIFADLGADDKVSLETVPAERGAIMDVHENPLAMNGIIYQVGLVPEQMENETTEVEKLAKLLDIKKETIEKALSADWV